MKRFFLFLILSGFLFLSPSAAFAKGEFTSSYAVTYDVAVDGQTEVTENITLKNLTDKFYPSSFTLNIAATQITGLEAFDADSVLETKIVNLGKKSALTVNFIKQFSGKGKEYKWTLKFKSTDFAQKVGNIWQVSVPKISNADDVLSYNLNLLVPVSFGEPTVLLPNPKKQLENAGKLELIYTKKELQNLGVMAYFGDHQTVNFRVSYNLENTTILPKTFLVSVPSNSQYQKVQINSINPKPENVGFDEDGNTIATFRLNRRQKIQAYVEGQAKLFALPQGNVALSKEQKQTYTKSQKYWEVDNPILRTRLDEIIQEVKGEKIKEMEAIHRFVAGYLFFEPTRLNLADYTRLGALTALSNPQKSLSAEFSDLTTALARADLIPTREVIGVGISNNHDLRPLSFEGNKLHSWVEYFDDQKGWVPIDPTWENTSGGVDYFTKPDLAHFILVRRGVSSTVPNSPSDIAITLEEKEFNPQPKLSLKIESPTQLYASFPAKVKIKVANIGSTIMPKSVLTLTSSKVQFVTTLDQLSKNLSFELPEIPPFGSYEYTYPLKTGPIFSSYEDDILLGVNSQVISQRIGVQPFYVSTPLIFAVISAILLIIMVYIIVLGLHLRISGSGISFSIKPNKGKKKNSK